MVIHSYCRRAFVAILLATQACANAVLHDDSFTPDYVLEANIGPVAINCETRTSVTFSGTTPGPTIYLTEGKTSWVRVYNRSPNVNITTHFHGLGMRSAPFSDGTPLVSQWPIAPGHFFDYEIRPEIGDAGTYFYHSHVGFQQVTAFGPVVVRDANGTAAHEYDEDIILSAADYYAANDTAVESGVLGSPFKWPGEPAAITIQNRSGSTGAGNATDPTCAPHVVEVDPGKTYRIRLVGATVLSLIKVGIEAHEELAVVEADGADTQPAPVDHMQVGPGQRLSYLLKTKTEDELRAEEGGRSAFWIYYKSYDRPKNVTGYAMLRYRLTTCPTPALPDALPATPPVTLPDRVNDYLEYQLAPKNDQQRFPTLAEVTRTVTIQVNQVLTSGQYVNGTANGTLVWAQNGSPWQENVQAKARQEPYLVNIYRNRQTPNYSLALEHGGFDPLSKAFPAKVGEVLDIVWQNNGGPVGGFESHPMHIHGDHAWDLGSGGGTYDAEENEKRFRDYTPVRRDTTYLYRHIVKGAPGSNDGWRAWRVRVTEDNVGAWMMHCHSVAHAVMGMNTVWVFGETEDIFRKFSAPPYVQGYLDFGGDAVGNSSSHPSVNHWFS